jgi:hypothetical protein
LFKTGEHLFKKKKKSCPSQHWIMVEPNNINDSDSGVTSHFHGGASKNNDSTVGGFFGGK